MLDAPGEGQQGDEPRAGQAEAAHAGGKLVPPVVGSPDTVTALQAATEASSDPSTPSTEVTSSSGASGSGSGERHAGSAAASGSAAGGAPSPTVSLTASESTPDLQQAVAAAVAQQEATRAAAVACSSGPQIPDLVRRLKERPLTGQVVAWGWDAAARMSAVRRTMPAQLFSSLWPATEACVFKMMPQVGAALLVAPWLKCLPCHAMPCHTFPQFQQFEEHPRRCCCLSALLLLYYCSC
jgi:hypothetical protein